MLRIPGYFLGQSGRLLPAACGAKGQESPHIRLSGLNHGYHLRSRLFMMSGT